MNKNIVPSQIYLRIIFVVPKNFTFRTNILDTSLELISVRRTTSKANELQK